MEKLRIRPILAAMAVAVACMGLASCGYWGMVTRYEPVLRSMEDVRASLTVAPEPPVFTVEGLGKITLSADRRFLFVNDVNRGVRVADLAVPAVPEWVGYIDVPGTVDLAYLELGGTEYLYVDSFVDLVILELDLPRTDATFGAVEVGRVLDAFPGDPYQWFWDDDSPVWFAEAIPADQVVVGYTTRTSLEWIETSFLPVYAMDGAGSGTAGASGSMARFALHEDADHALWYLYAVDSYELRTFSLADPSTPNEEPSMNAGWSIETIFPYRDLLFLGSTSALYIYDVSNSPDSSPKSPVKRATLNHFAGRDPVVVGPVGTSGSELDTAFVTISEDRWGWGDNVLIAVDVSDPTAPLDIVRRNMYGPRGLGLLGNTLFVCEGDHGFVAVDVTHVRDGATLDERLAVKQYARPASETYDVIPGDAYQIVVGTDGITLYDYDEGTGALTTIGELAAGAAD